MRRQVHSDPEAELNDEFRFHMEAEVEALVAEGMTPEAARAEALRRFGDVSQFRQRSLAADHRREHRVRWRERVEVVGQDARYTLRSLMRQPVFTLVSLITLGLGIGANTAIFTVLHGVLFTPLPYREPDRLVTLWETLPNLPQIVVSYPDYLDWKKRAHSFEDIAVYSVSDGYTLTGAGDPETVHGGLASGNLFSLLGVRPELGRLLAPTDDHPAADPVVVLTDAFWRRRFGADPGVLGRRILLDGLPYVVAGVLPQAFQLNPRSDLWLPLGRFTDLPKYVRQNHPGLLGAGRLKPGVTLEAMRADLAEVSRQIRTEFPAEAAGIGADGMAMGELSTRQIRPVLVMLATAVGLVLLLASANVANLLLGRAAARQKEFALRIAIGAGRGRLVRQLLTESVLLALAGGVLGVGLAWAGVRVLLALKPAGLPRLTEIQLDPVALAFAFGVSLLTGLLFGLFPALQVARHAPVAALRENSRSSTGGPGRGRMRAGLTVAEVALALMLLMGAGLLLKSFLKLAGVEPGVTVPGISAGLVILPMHGYPDEPRRLTLYEGLLARVRQEPGVLGAAFSSDLPVASSWQSGFTIEGSPPASPGDRPMFNAVSASPEYFNTVGLPLQAGRGFEAGDDAAHPRVVVVSQAIARKFFGSGSAVGRRIKQGADDATANWITIVGVVGDVKNDGITTLIPRGTVYFPLAQSVSTDGWVIVRSEAPVSRIAGLLRRHLAELDRELPVTRVTTLEDELDASVAQPRFSMLMLSAFAGVALVLAAVGLYGVISYGVTQQTREIGVRIALGARRGQVLGQVVGRAMLLAGIGIGLGSLGALAGGRLLAKLLYQVSAGDPLVLAGVAGLVVLVALIAAGIPAFRASRIDPVTAMRE